MQTAFVLLVLIAVASAKTVAIHSIFNSASANVWSGHGIEVDNTDRVGSSYAIENVQFEVLVTSSDNQNERLGVFYGYGNAVGQIGAIMGNSSGIGSFWLIGDAGTYQFTVYVYYQVGSQQRIAQQDFQFYIGSAHAQFNSRELSLSESAIPSDAVLVAKNEDFSLFATRDGSNADLQGDKTLCCLNSLSGIESTFSWNTYYMDVGLTKLYNVAPSYSMNSSVLGQFTNPGLNGTSSVWVARGQYKLSFAIETSNSQSQPGNVWYMNIGFTYNKGSNAGPAGAWSMSYAVNVATGSKREVRSTNIREVAQVAIENANHSAKLGNIFAVAGAAVACVAAVAIVAALVTIRKNRQSALSA